MRIVVMQRLRIVELLRKVRGAKCLLVTDDVRMRCLCSLRIAGNSRIRSFPLIRNLTTAVDALPVEEKERREIDISDADERLYNRINVKVKGFDYAVLDSYSQFVMKAGRMLGIGMSGKVNLPTRIQKFTLLKSPFIYKKHRVQYELRIHSRLLQIRNVTGTTADIFLEYIQRNIPEGVSMSIYQESAEKAPHALAQLLKEAQKKAKETKQKK